MRFLLLIGEHCLAFPSPANPVRPSGQRDPWLWPCAAIQAKAPNTKILLVSNWPFFDKGTGGSRRRMDTINAALKEFAEGKKVRLLEISERRSKCARRNKFHRI